MSTSLRDTILHARDRVPHGPIRIDEWDVDIWIRTLTLGERLRVAEAASEAGIVPFALLCVLAIGDESGERVFGDEDADALAGKSPTVLERIATLALAHNKMRPEDTEAAQKN